MMKKNSKPTVIDFFCGAGGFSEGFRQQGYEIVAGYDYWKPAIETYSHNFGSEKGIQKDILDYNISTSEIESLPDTDVIIGSPPCVTFSSSNNSGKADKTSGITLTLIFLKVVAVKKWKPDSILKGWFMENVPSSINHLQSEYTFEELGLSQWAFDNNIESKKIAIRLEGNQKIINSADYGSAQTRERVIAGEIIKKKKLIIPEATHAQNKIIGEKLKPWISLKEIKGKLPNPTCSKSSRKVYDPNYPWVYLKLDELTDHFYDSGLFKCEWKQSEFLKVNHPYMGRMSFPEDENRPSRTITATKIGTSREAIIYRSEFNRSGNGEFRVPTIREASCLMGFPITYQFLGGETTKWRLIGNAVCPSVARALAKQLRESLRFPEIKKPLVQKHTFLENVNNLNTYSVKKFGRPPRRNKGSRFRRHPFKDGNLTVTLSNYDIYKNEKEVSKWITSVQYGNGKDFPIFNYPDNYYSSLEKVIMETKTGLVFLDVINNGFSKKVGTSSLLQEMYEEQKSQNGFLEPTELVEKVRVVINRLNIDSEKFIQNETIIFKNKQIVPVKQLFALYALNKVASIANK